ncbi:MAG: protein kinase [Acidobacteria bacterium]|nr:protein kinase [Acidobacteriota bacterium]
MTQRTCPECHAEIPADAPPGVCPYCALRAGLRWEASTDADRRRGRATPLPPEELERRLPDLDGFELIGPGGMGTVYRARHRPLDRPVAVKVLHAHLQDDPAFAERFAREARTMARLDHPHIVRVYDFGDREGLYYLVMELVEGVTLRQAMASGSLAPAEALAIVPRICEALQYAHDQGVVHRDIKPENILLDRAGAPKIVDFGLALLTGSSTDTRLTEHARVLGTPHYMAPEQIEHPSQVDHRADIYALGVVFYEMLTGELPIGRFPPPSQKVEVDVRLDQVVLRTLEKEPRRRYQQASELRSDVRQSVVGEGLPADGAQRVHPLGATDLASDAGWTPTRRGWRRGRRRADRTGFEYRSRRTVWGLPLVHVAHDASGDRVAWARGVVAIGDAAVGLVAIGGFAFGGVALGGMTVGVVGLGGLALGLLLAMGGLAAGGFAVGARALGVVATGAQPTSLLDVSAPAMQWLSLAAWGLATAVVTALVAGLILWLQDPGARRRVAPSAPRASSGPVRPVAKGAPAGAGAQAGAGASARPPGTAGGNRR